MKTIIITGASGSVGEAATLAMARKGWHVIMACRNIEKGRGVMERILSRCHTGSGVSSESGSKELGFFAPDTLVLQELEMSSTDSIHAFAERLRGRQIDALFNNAGIMCRNFTRVNDEAFLSLPNGRAGVGLEFAVNYLGTALLTKLIIPLMPQGGNIVNMVSLTTRFAKLGLNWMEWDEHHFGQLSTYGASKLALLYHTIALAKRHPELHINVADPGIVNSNMITMHRWYDPLADIFFRPFIKTPERGAAPAIRALESNCSLLYYVGKKNNPIPSRFMNSPLIEPLWEQLEAIQ